MKFVPDVWGVLGRSYPMWSIYLGLVCLILPNALWGLWQIEADPYPIGWAALVFLMHLGFATLEAGLTQSKNTVNILFKNMFIQINSKSLLMN